MPYNKHNYRVNVPNRSGFDKSHRNSGTLTCGTLTPILCDEVIPNSRVSLKLNLATQLPPLASDTYMNLKLKAEAFFVPMRLCCGSFEDFFCDVPKDYYTVSGGNYAPSNSKMVVPPLLIDPADYTTEGVVSPNYAADIAKYLGPGTLADYLGFTYNVLGSGDDDTGAKINLMPFIAYALIVQEWYMNPRVQKKLFVPSFHNYSSLAPISCMPFEKFVSGTAYKFNRTTLTMASGTNFRAGNLVLNDGSTIFDLRQRNFPLDYFTGARVDAQQGSASAVQLDTSIGDNGGFTIAQLRAANSLQQFRERNNLPSPRLVDQVKARYGANLSDGVAQRPICIGTASYDVASTGISQTAEGSGSGSQNPFSSVASQYGRAYGNGSDFIISDFTVNEPGYIMVLISLVPEVTYTSLWNRMFSRYIADGSIVEMANPLLQNIGDQPIMSYELTAGPGSTYASTPFGYQDRYSEFMFIPNQVHGLMRDGQSLSAFVLQRDFSDAVATGVEISSEFLEIPKDYLDGVMAASSGVSGLSAWYDSYLDYKVSMPLAEFSIPSLQDPAYEHGHSVSLRRNGQIF